MWAKTLLGLLMSLLLNASLMLNIAFAIPIDRQTYFLFGFIGGSMTWAAIMTVFYCANSLKPILYCVPILLLSAGLNTLFYLGFYK